MENQFPKKNYKLVYISSFFLFFLGLWIVFYLANLNLGENSLSFSNFKILDIQISWQALTLYAKSRLKNHIVQLILQLIIILGFSRFLTLIVRKLGQPSVIGEMFSGILLGPSALGIIAPEVFQLLFPKESLENLHNLSLFGLITFMFVLGMEFDIGIFESKIRSAVLISHLNIIFPFLLGTILAYFLYKEYASPTSNFLSFSLFMGVSLSITAFPVLARIVQEKKLMKLSLGSMAIMCAAIDDFTAWIILAAIISIVNSQGILTAIFSFLAVILYILFMLKFLQPFLTRLSRVYVTQEIIGRGVLSFLTLVLLTSALVTEILGIHAIFGAFLAGAIMPNVGELRKVLAEKTEDFTSIFLLPLFFAYTGLRTQVHLLYDWNSLVVTIIVILVASVAKILSASLAAKYVGMNWKESFGLGILMNTRGLVELVVLNIGYDLGILSPKIFTIMVIMALVTTIATGPIIKFLFPEPTKQKYHKPDEKQNTRVLISFGPPHSGEVLFNLATQIFGSSFQYSALHVTPFPESLTIDRFKDIKKINLEGLQKISSEKRIPVKTIFRMTNQITEEILNVIEEENPEFVLLGGAQSIFLDNALGGKVEAILNNSNKNLGIFIGKNFSEVKSVLLFYKHSKETEILFQIASLIQKNRESEINLVYTKGNEPNENQLRKFFSNPIRFTEQSKLPNTTLEKYSLLLIGYNHWIDIYSNEEEKNIFYKDNKEITKSLSILILRAKE